MARDFVLQRMMNGGSSSSPPVLRHLGGQQTTAPAYNLEDVDDPYSLAWRYLGAYVADCDGSSAGGTTRRRRRRRELSEQEEENGADEDDEDDDSGDDEDDDDLSCERVVLWALYRDPNYAGNSIGGYQFYDASTKQWDKSTCQTTKQRQCRKLDCHTRKTGFELIGVFQERSVLQWTETLLWHQCLYNTSTLSHMFDVVEKHFPDGCVSLDRFVDGNGNQLYESIKPMHRGDLSIGLYLDDQCSIESSDITYFDYVMAYEQTYNYKGSEQSLDVAMYIHEGIEWWNSEMDTYKVCQPCPAYSRTISSSNKERLLESNDEEEAEEQWGYNCHDAGGVTNCNLCDKFLTKLNMKQATTEDLERASAQGSIMEITVDGVVYGSGVVSHAFLSSFDKLDANDLLSLDVLTLVVAGGMLLGVMMVFIRRQLEPKRQQQRRRKNFPKWYKERLVSDETSVDDSTRIDKTESIDDDIRVDKTVSTFAEDESISEGGGCRAAEDRVADMWLIFSPNTDLEELEGNGTMESGP